MATQDVTLVKLGGSVISNKSVAFSYRDKAVTALGRAIAASARPVVVVHGGGSFGHVVAKKYGLSSTRSTPSKGVSETRGAMFALDAKVCASLSKAGLRPYPFAPFSLLDREGGAGFLQRLLQGGMTPVTFGDVVPDGKGFSILSGDTICVELAEMLGAKLCVMAMDVDGLLDGKGKVIDLVDGETRDIPQPRGKGRLDATGGISFKVREALRMASSGTEVKLVSGLKPAEFSRALSGGPFLGTRVKSAVMDENP